MVDRSGKEAIYPEDCAGADLPWTDVLDDSNMMAFGSYVACTLPALASFDSISARVRRSALPKRNIRPLSQQSSHLMGLSMKMLYNSISYSDRAKTLTPVSQLSGRTVGLQGQGSFWFGSGYGRSSTSDLATTLTLQGVDKQLNFGRCAVADAVCGKAWADIGRPQSTRTRDIVPEIKESSLRNVLHIDSVACNTQSLA